MQHKVSCQKRFKKDQKGLNVEWNFEFNYTRPKCWNAKICQHMKILKKPDFTGRLVSAWSSPCWLLLAHLLASKKRWWVAYVVRVRRRRVKVPSTAKSWADQQTSAQCSETKMMDKMWKNDEKMGMTRGSWTVTPCQAPRFCCLLPGTWSWGCYMGTIICWDVNLKDAAWWSWGPHKTLMGKFPVCNIEMHMVHVRKVLPKKCGHLIIF